MPSSDSCRTAFLELSFILSVKLMNPNTVFSSATKEMVWAFDWISEAFRCKLSGIEMLLAVSKLSFPT